MRTPLNTYLLIDDNMPKNEVLKQIVSCIMHFFPTAISSGHLSRAFALYPQEYDIDQYEDYDTIEWDTQLKLEEGFGYYLRIERDIYLCFNVDIEVSVHLFSTFYCVNLTTNWFPFVNQGNRANDESKERYIFFIKFYKQLVALLNPIAVLIFTDQSIDYCVERTPNAIEVFDTSDLKELWIYNDAKIVFEKSMPINNMLCNKNTLKVYNFDTSVSLWNELSKYDK